MADIKTTIISAILIAVFTITIVTGSITFAAENGQTKKLFSDGINVSEIEASLININNSQSSWEGTVFQGVEDTAFGKTFQIISTMSSVWSAVKVTINEIAQVIVNVFDIPVWLSIITLATIAIVGIIYAWKVYRQGE